MLVSTKFDTRIPQFSRAADVELFLKPSRTLLEASPLGGGPFFSSVPSGRVGLSREALFRSNDHYREAVLNQELADIAEVEKRLDRRLEGAERGRVGVSQLRQFLERLLQRRYLVRRAASPRCHFALPYSLARHRALPNHPDPATAVPGSPSRNPGCSLCRRFTAAQF